MASCVIFCSRASVYRMAAAPSPSILPKFPCPSISGIPFLKSCVRTTSASQIELSPCGWYLPIVSPTMRALFRQGRSYLIPSSCISYKVRRCTGFRPSLTSGSALAMMTLMAQSMKDRCMVSAYSVFIILSSICYMLLICYCSPSHQRSGPRAVLGLSYIEFRLRRVFIDESPPRQDICPHQQFRDLGRHAGILDLDLFQDPSLGIQGRLPELFRIHLAKPLIPLQGE